MRYKRMFIISILAVLLFLTVCTVQAFAATSTYNLVQGQTYNIGTVTITDLTEGGKNYLIIDAVITDTTWYMTGAAVGVWDYDPHALSTNPGGLPYQTSDGVWESPTHVTYKVPYPGAAVLGDTVYIYFHAMAGQYGPTEYLNDIALPDRARFNVYAGWESLGAYLLVRVNEWVPTSTMAPFNTVPMGFPGYCLDWTKNIDQYPTEYWGNVRSSYNTNVNWASLFNHPENLDLINWVINQKYVGKTAPHGTYNYGDVQLAIWKLLQGSYPDNLWLRQLGNYDTTLDNANQIVALAQAWDAANSNDYRPGAGDLLVVVIMPDNPNVQPVFIYLKVPAGQGTGTACAAKILGSAGSNGKLPLAWDFDAKNWFCYVQHPDPGVYPTGSVKSLSKSK